MSAESSTPPTSADLDSSALGVPELSWVWARHLSSFLIPINSLVFLWTGPHVWYVAPLFMLPLMLLLDVDSNAMVEKRQPLATTPAWPFDLIVYGLSALQLLIIYELSQMFTTQGFFSVDSMMAFLIVGGSSGFSIITAHELIHRSRPWERNLGRLLLATVLQEHFFTEHLRGHHVKVASPEDPATAEFGESYEAFYRRTIPAQFKSAWRLERKRLGDAEMSFFDPRMLRNRVLHGLLLGWGIGAAIWAHFGFVPFLAFVLQAFMSSRLLEAVNYFEHWGLRRKTTRVRPTDSWDTHSWFTYYGLTGLSRHADHHRDPSRPYQQLQIFEEAPMLPAGYIGMIDLVSGKNDEFKKLAVEELMRRELGPFSPETDPEEAAAAREVADQILAYEAPSSPGLFGVNERGERGLAVVLSRIAKPVALILVVTLGVQFEAAESFSFAGRFALNSWIFVSFALMFWILRTLSERGLNISVSSTAALATFALLGKLTASAIGL